MSTDVVTPINYDPDAPGAGRHTYAEALLAEAKGLYRDVERFYVLMMTIKEGEHYRNLPGHYKSYAEFVEREFGVSRATGNRWIEQGRALEALGPGNPEPAGRGVSRRETNPSGIERPTGPRISGREAARQAASRRSPAPEPAPDTTKSEPATPEDAPRAPRRPQKPPVEAPPPAPRQSSIPPEIEEAIRATEAALTGAMPEIVVVPAAEVDEAIRAGTDNPNGRLVIPAEAVPEDWEFPAARMPTPEQVARANLDDLLRFLARFEPAKLAAVAKQADREAIAAFAAHFVVVVPARKAARRETAYVDQKDCTHPVNQRIGSGCGACGKGNLK